MALTDGVNCGFVTERPTGDPSGLNLTIDNNSRAGKFTAPAGATAITEIGWYCDNATEESNFEVGIYDDDGGGANSIPVNRLAVNDTNAKGTDAGWKYATVNYAITAGTIYWLAVELDNTATTTSINGANGGGRRDYALGQTTLENPFPSAGPSDNLLGIYAIYTTASGSNIPKRGFLSPRKGFW